MIDDIFGVRNDGILCCKGLPYSVYAWLQLLWVVQILQSIYYGKHPNDKLFVKKMVWKCLKCEIVTSTLHTFPLIASRAWTQNWNYVLIPSFTLINSLTSWKWLSLLKKINNVTQFQILKTLISAINIITLTSGANSLCGMQQRVYFITNLFFDILFASESVNFERNTDQDKSFHDDLCSWWHLEYPPDRYQKMLLMKLSRMQKH